jgi:hypothetical protein
MSAANRDVRGQDSSPMVRDGYYFFLLSPSHHLPPPTSAALSSPVLACWYHTLLKRMSDAFEDRPIRGLPSSLCYECETNRSLCSRTGGLKKQALVQLSHWCCFIHFPHLILPR